MLSDVQIEEIAHQNKETREEDRAIKKLIELSETNPKELEEFQSLCVFLNFFTIAIGDC